MKVTVVGTSCTWFKRNNTSFIIDDEIIFDTPAGSYKDVIKIINLSNVKCIFITHFHTDHFTDLHAFVTQIMRYHKDRKEKLRVYGPKGILNRLTKLNKLFCGSKDERSKKIIKSAVDFIEVHDGMEIVEGKYRIKAFKVEHGEPETFGFTFDDGRVVVGFSADTRPCENLDKIVASSNFAFVDFTIINFHPKHMYLKPFEELMKKYPNTKIFPVHTTDEAQKYAMEHKFNYLNDGDVLEF